jgi:hypothetical protein
MASLMNTPIQALAPEDAASVGPAQAYTSTKDAIDQWIENQRAQSAAQGMWDPVTNLPTLKGMHEAVQQLGYNFEGGLKPKGLLNAPIGEAVPGLADRISTRVPTAVGSDNPHLNADLMVGLESSQNSPAAFQKNANLIRTYPDIRTEGMPDAAAVSEGFISHLKDNLLALHDSIPPEIRARAQQWYEGANTIANRMSEQYGISPRSAAATLAANNNIISPNSPNGDVTIDTHAIAAGHMRPLGGNDPIVEAGLGMSPASSAAATGSRGLYGLYAEAYRRAAAQAGILPRQMQSITWEGVRGLFSPEQKRNANLVNSVNGIWDQYRQGQIDAPTARTAITELAGGINAPEWTGRSP